MLVLYAKSDTTNAIKYVDVGGVVANVVMAVPSGLHESTGQSNVFILNRVRKYKDKMIFTYRIVAQAYLRWRYNDHRVECEW